MEKMWMYLYFASWCSLLTDPPDWRTHLSPQFRRNLITKMMNTFKGHYEVTRLGVPNGIKNMAELFEGETYAYSTSLSDYLTKISVRMLNRERTLPPVVNSFQSNPGTSNQKPAVSGPDLFDARVFMRTPSIM